MKTATSRVRGVEHDIVQMPQAGDKAPYYEPQANEVAIFEAAYKRRLPVMARMIVSAACAVLRCANTRGTRSRLPGLCSQ